MTNYTVYILISLSDDMMMMMMMMAYNDDDLRRHPTLVAIMSKRPSNLNYTSFVRKFSRNMYYIQALEQWARMALMIT